jgi:Uma2 family endonuclease
MQALEKIRLSDEQVAMLETGQPVMISASWAEFDEFLDETDYRTEFNNGQIILMGLATLIHELLVIRLGHILTNFYVGQPIYVAGSNTGIRKEQQKGHYNGDVLVIKGKPVYQEKSRSIITNPFLIVEVPVTTTSVPNAGNTSRWKRYRK